MALVIQISDTHLKADDPRPERRVAAIVDQLAEGDRPDLVLLTGDLADDATVEGCRRLRTLVEPLGAPLVALAGNHDAPDPVTEAFGAPGAVELGPWSIVPIDTWVAGATAGAVDVASAGTALDAHEGRPTLVAMHHPPSSPSAHPWFALEGGEAFLDLVAARPWVRAVVSGHLHLDFDRVERGVRILGAPSTFYALDHDGAEFAYAPEGTVGAVRLELDADGRLEREVVALVDA